MKLHLIFTIFSFIILSGCIAKKNEVSTEKTGSMTLSAPSAVTDTSISYTVTYKNAKEITLASTDVELVKTGTVNGLVTITGEGLESRLITIHSITGVGSIGLKLKSGTAQFTKAKKAAAITGTPFQVQQLAPQITISSPTALRTRTGPVSFTVNYSGASIIMLNSSSITLLTSGTATGVVSVAETGLAQRTVTISAISGEGTLGFQIEADSAVSAAGKYSLSAISPVLTTVDITPPAISISAPNISLTRTGPVSYTVNYTEAASISLLATDISLDTTGTATGIISVTGTGASTRTVTISSITGTGTLGFSIGGNTAMDSVANSSLAPSASPLITVDNTPPVVSVSAPSLGLTNTGPISYTISISGATTVNMTAAYVTLNRTGTANGVVTLSGSGLTTRTVTISSITGDGTLGVTIASASALDAAGNQSAASAASTVFTVDNTSSGIAFSAPSLTDTNNTPVTYTLTYADAASISLINSDVTIVRTGTANAVATVGGAGVVNRTVTLSSITGSGTLAIRLISGTAIDSSGNLALSTGNSTPFNVDITPPAITISAPSVAATNTAPVTFTVNYAGANAVTLASGDIVVNKTGTADATAVVSGAGTAARTVTLGSITGEGTIGIRVNAGTATDTAGNVSLASSVSSTFNVDTTPPGVSFAAPSRKATSTTSLTIVANYTGASAITLTNANITVTPSGTATAVATVSGAGTASRTITLSGITGSGDLKISMAAGTATDAAGNATAAPADSEFVYVTNDPLFFQSWHLYNTAQTAFSSSAGIAGIDLNIIDSWLNGYKGSGINILVSDTGVQSAHPDLAANFLGGTVSHDYINGSSPDWLFATGEPVLGNDGDSHGTAVAGIIAAVANNGIGGQGVAPLAKISSANFLESGQTGLEALSQLDSAFDIINQSWGAPQCSIDPPFAAYEAKLAADRKIYVKSSGNDFNLDLDDCSRPAANFHGNSVFENLNNNPYTIVVGALNASGVKASYSSPGSNLWISGFGGQFGTTAPAIITTDLTGCTYGQSPNDNYNSFQSGHPLNTLCNYTSIMNGTSSAAPTVSGSIAVLLSANNLLTARDVKHILATTAVKVNPSASSTANQYSSSPAGHVYQQGWVTNAAGYDFHNYYGFGMINTDAAVAMATTSYTLLGAELQTGYTASGALGAAIPDADAAGVERTIAIGANYIIEGVQITTNITHNNIGQLGIELTSPSGTKSILVNVNSALDGLVDLTSEVFLTNAFYGENSNGNWRVKIIDGKAGTTGTLNSWSINIIGR